MRLRFRIASMMRKGSGWLVVASAFDQGGYMGTVAFEREPLEALLGEEITLTSGRTYVFELGFVEVEPDPPGPSRACAGCGAPSSSPPVAPCPEHTTTERITP